GSGRCVSRIDAGATTGGGQRADVMSAPVFFRALIAVNVRMARRHVIALREKSWLMLSVIVTFVLCYWIASYLLFHFGFAYLTTKVPGLGALLVDRMLYLFF